MRVTLINISFKKKKKTLINIHNMRVNIFNVNKALAIEKQLMNCQTSPLFSYLIREDCITKKKKGCITCTESLCV